MAGHPFTRDSLRGIGALVNGPGLWSRMNARQHIRVHSKLCGVDPDDAVARLLPLVGMDQIADRKVSAYSLGMRWRLGIATAMVSSPVCSCSTNRPTGPHRYAGDACTDAPGGRNGCDRVRLQPPTRPDRPHVRPGGRDRARPELLRGPLSGLARDGDLEEGFFALVDQTSNGTGVSRST
ncbi:lantibiotic ABC transporter ATP-binding protein [Nocardiopsis salina]|uniref:lantibiotic ABC transporter ATP-binding protein n=1 Tax=Nocardiopsis salina TaxID=245836 RepID=UPI00034BC709|nr:lantibiotic ABC transporter ATP-binding protein [Nocardiopsis salina]